MTALNQSWKFPGNGWKRSFDPKKLLKMLKQMFKKNRPLSIADYFDERLVVFLKADTQMQVIEELIDAIDAAHLLKDKEKFHEAVLNREKIVSTGIGLGVAVPHAKLPEYQNFFVAIGIREGKGIEWNSIDGSPVHLVFMIGGPDHRQNEYLEVLSRLTVAIKDSERRKALLRATSARQVIDLFKGC